MNNVFRRLAPAVALCLPLAAHTQATRVEPADPKAPAPTLRYQSAFSDYKPWQDAKPGDWRALNDGLGAPAASRAGGAHAMPSAAGSSAPKAGMPGAEKPAHADHQHQHGGHR